MLSTTLGAYLFSSPLKILIVHQKNTERTHTQMRRHKALGRMYLMTLGSRSRHDLRMSNVSSSYWKAVKAQ